MPVNQLLVGLTGRKDLLTLKGRNIEHVTVSRDCVTFVFDDNSCLTIFARLKDVVYSK